ncbi:MAG: hypothetical protein EOO24_22770 [Comamonadaceae bacterium]|nr:MAG: hypothetical protein EOO24_22770 [Comamonadaceae bacterium]
MPTLHRLIPGVAVATVTLAALAAAWMAPRADAPVVAERPVLRAEPPDVVKAPAVMQPATCRDCMPAGLSARSL